MAKREAEPDPVGMPKEELRSAFAQTQKRTDMDETNSTGGLRERLAGRLTCSIDEAARLLGIGRSTAYAAAHDGSLPVLRISNRLLVSVPRLLEMVGVERR